MVRQERPAASEKSTSWLLVVRRRFDEVAGGLPERDAGECLPFAQCPSVDSLEATNHAIIDHHQHTPRPTDFNRAFGVAVLVLVFTMASTCGPQACVGPLVYSVLGAGAKLLGAYEFGGRMRANPRALDCGTAVFHLCFGVALRRVARLIIPPRWPTSPNHLTLSPNYCFLPFLSVIFLTGIWCYLIV